MQEVRGYKGILDLDTLASPSDDAFFIVRDGDEEYRVTLASLRASVDTGNWTGTFDGQEGVWYLDRAHHSGTQLAATISDFTSAAQAAAAGIALTAFAGTLTGAKGGTGLTGYATGDLLVGVTPSSLAKLPDVAVNNVLLSGGVGASPYYGKVDLTLAVSGILPADKGGKDTQPTTPWGGMWFDGTDDYANANPLTGLVDGKEGTVMAWLYFDELASARALSEYYISNTGEAFAFYRKTNGAIELRVENAAGTIVTLLTSATGAALAAGLYCVRAAWNTAVAGAGRIRATRVAAGAIAADSMVVTESNFVQDGIVDYTVTGWAFASRSTGVNGYFKGNIHVVWFMPVWLDINLPAVNSKFIGADGTPVFLGFSGELVTGAVPPLFVGYDKLKNLLVNRGSALGSFTINSAPTEATVEFRGQYFPRVGKDKTDANASAVTLSKLDAKKIFSNEGAAANVVFTLPPADSVSDFGFFCADADGLQITATNGNTIIVDGAETAANGSISTVQVGAFVRLRAINQLKWAATVTIGDWTGRTLRAGAATFSGAVAVANTAPYIEWNETDRTTDNKIWRWYGTGAQFNLYPVSDAGTLGAVALSFTRSGNAAVAATFGVPVVLPADPVNVLEAATKQYADKKVKTLTISTTGVGNVGVGEDNLITYSLPAATLAVDKDSVIVEMGGIFAASANTKRLRFYFGATMVLDTGALAVTLAGSWQFRMVVTRTGAATQKIMATLNTSQAAMLANAAYVTAAETLSGAVTIKATGEATANDDIRQEMLLVNFVNNA